MFRDTVSIEALTLHDYVPMIRGKMGEYSALAKLSSNTKVGMRPLIMIPDIDVDRETSEPKRSLQEHLQYHKEKITQNWGGELPLYINTRSIDGEVTQEGEDALIALTRMLTELGVLGIPAVSTTQALRLSSQLSDLVKDTGLCLILDQHDLNIDADSDLSNKVDDLISRLGVEPAKIDLLMDYGGFEPEQANLITLAAIASISIVPYLDSWRSFIITGTSFPQKISDEIPSNSWGHLPRSEWKIWKSLQRRNLPRKPTFGDYLVDSPEISLAYVPGMQIPVVLRYTTNEDWLILKGGTIQNPGNEQFYELCTDLVGRDEDFEGEHFSWGDEAIYKRAYRQEGPGNPQLWRKIAINHHITKVVRQLTSFGDS